MSAILSRLSPPAGAKTSEKRIGRGVGSRLGKTGGRGSKGQKARTGGAINKLHFQGGQTPMQRRLPKRGFRVPFPVETAAVNVGDLDVFDAGSVVDEAALRKVRLVQGKGPYRIKILADGEIAKALTVHANRFSKAAREKIEQAGGTVVIVPEHPGTEEAVASEAASG